MHDTLNHSTSACDEIIVIASVMESDRIMSVVRGSSDGHGAAFSITSVTRRYQQRVMSWMERNTPKGKSSGTFSR